MTDLADGPEAGSARPGATRRQRAVVAVGLVLGGLAVGFVVRTLVVEWPRVAEEIRSARVGWLVVAFALAAAGMASIGWAWGGVLRALGVRVPTRRVVPWYFVGELGKYLPGGVWPVLGRGELARRGGVPRGRAYASVALSLGVLYLAAMFVAVAFLPFALSGGGFSPWMLCLLALPLGVAALHHDVLGRVVAFVEARTGRHLDVEIPRWGTSLGLVLRYVPTWLCIGSATWAVARSVTSDLSYPRVVFAAVLSWIVGFLAVPVPSGAGIRETVLYAASGLDRGLSVFTAVAARLAFVVVDLGGAALAAPLVRRARAGAVVGPRPGHRPAADVEAGAEGPGGAGHDG